MKRYLVIGAPGQVGQEFKRLLSSGAFIGLSHADIEVANSDSVRRVLSTRANSYDAVINLAAFQRVDLCEADPWQAFAVNAIGALNIAREAARRYDRVCFVSTDCVFGAFEHRSPRREGEEREPVNVYGLSKAAGEIATLSTGHNLVVRTTGIFGVTTSRKGSTFPELMINRARRGEMSSVVADRIVSPTYARDLAETIIDLMERGVEGIAHVINGGACSWFDFAREAVNLSGMDGNRWIKPTTAAKLADKTPRPAYGVLKNTREDVPHLRHWREALVAYVAEREALHGD